MLKINDKEIRDFDVKISWADFSVSGINGKRSGKAPFICFSISNETYLGIETTIPKEWLDEYPLSKEIEINNYISDLSYEDVKGWYSMISEKYSCSIIRTNKTKFELKLHIESEEFEKISIDLDQEIEILK